MRNLTEIERVVVKVGTSTLTNENGMLNQVKISHLVAQLAQLMHEGKQVVLVTSGAIGAGMGVLGMNARPETIPQKQACAAIGQVYLIDLYQRLLAQHGLICAQMLLNHDDFTNRERLLNMTNMFNALFDQQVMPIINENDAVSIDEIKIGDNDTLGGFVSSVVGADLYVILSDIDGLFTANPQTNPEATILHHVDGLSEAIYDMAGGAGSKLGTGGMVTKLNAAKIVTTYGGQMMLLNGSRHNGIIDAVKGEMIGTLFTDSKAQPLHARQHWIAYRSKASGMIIVDAGAKVALTQKRTSLLPKGVVQVEGDFLVGEIVEIADEQGTIFARGIVQYASHEISLIKGLHSQAILDILHEKHFDEIIHANNLVIF
ncbi:MAG: glutamate 5-kinase [Culicoidibacterales bacterium]